MTQKKDETDQIKNEAVELDEDDLDAAVGGYTEDRRCKMGKEQGFDQKYCGKGNTEKNLTKGSLKMDCVGVRSDDIDFIKGK